MKLPDDVHRLLRAEAERRGTTISEVAREAIEAHLRPEAPRRFLAAGAGDSGREDVSERIEVILSEELA